MSKMILNVTDENSELLERIEVEVTTDARSPLGDRLARASVLSEIEDAARTIQARESKGYYTKTGAA